MNTQELCRSFYTKNIRKFARYDFVTNHLNKISFNFLKGISLTDCQRWANIPIDYLSAREALALGIYIKSSLFPIAENQDPLKYFEYALLGHHSNKSSEIHYYATMALGIFYFEEALKVGSEKQKKILKICDHYFEECEDSNFSDELLALHRMIVETAKEDKARAIKYLLKGSKVSAHPEILFQVLSSIYLELGMEQIAYFYSQKAQNKYPDKTKQSA